MIEEHMREFPATAEPCLPIHLRKPRLRRFEVPEYLRVMHGIEIAVATLAKFATIGGGPGYQKCLRTPMYPRDELDRWAIARLGPLRKSSSDNGENA
jgi:hypothetical protein